MRQIASRFHRKALIFSLWRSNNPPQTPIQYGWDIPPYLFARIPSEHP